MICCRDIPPSSMRQLASSPSSDSNSKETNVFELSDIYLNFVKSIEKYRPLRRMLRDIDENTWVLDPPEGSDRINLEYTYRRVAISKGVSLQIDLKIENCLNQLPSLKFLGPEDKIRPLRELFGQNIDKYDSDYTLVQNLEMVLELEFPQQERIEEQVREILSKNQHCSNHKYRIHIKFQSIYGFNLFQDDLNLECSICYSYRLADQFPTENCDDPTGCRKSFHQMCLLEWLRSLPEQCSKMSIQD